MGSFGIQHWLIVLVVVMLLFGRGRISDVMGEFAKGIKSFKKGMADDDQAAEAAKAAPRPVEHQPSEPASVSPVARDTKTG